MCEQTYITAQWLQIAMLCSSNTSNTWVRSKSRISQKTLVIGNLYLYLFLKHVTFPPKFFYLIHLISFAEGLSPFRMEAGLVKGETRANIERGVGWGGVGGAPLKGRLGELLQNRFTGEAKAGKAKKKASSIFQFIFIRLTNSLHVIVP